MEIDKEPRMTTTNDAPAQASVATWHPLDENGLAELRVNGKRVTTFPSYPAAEEAAQRINAALSPPPTVGSPAPSVESVAAVIAKWVDEKRFADAPAFRMAAREIIASLDSDASPRGEAVAWRVRPIGDKGWHLSHEPPRMGYEGEALYAHPAPATVEGLRKAAECALGHLTGNMDGDWSLGDPVEMLRAALAPATEGRKG